MKKLSARVFGGVCFGGGCVRAETGPGGGTGTARHVGPDRLRGNHRYRHDWQRGHDRHRGHDRRPRARPAPRARARPAATTAPRAPPARPARAAAARHRGHAGTTGTPAAAAPPARRARGGTTGTGGARRHRGHDRPRRHAPATAGSRRFDGRHGGTTGTAGRGGGGAGRRTGGGTCPDIDELDPQGLDGYSGRSTERQYRRCPARTIRSTRQRRRLSDRRVVGHDRLHQDDPGVQRERDRRARSTPSTSTSAASSARAATRAARRARRRRATAPARTTPGTPGASSTTTASGTRWSFVSRRRSRADAQLNSALRHLLHELVPEHATASARKRRPTRRGSTRPSRSMGGGTITPVVHDSNCRTLQNCGPTESQPTLHTERRRAPSTCPA